MNHTAQTVWSFRFKLLSDGYVQVACCRMWSLSQGPIDPPMVTTLMGCSVARIDKPEIKVANSLGRFFERNIPALRSAYMIVVYGNAHRIGPALDDALRRSIPHYETQHRPIILGYEMVTPAMYRPELLLVSRCGLSYGLSAYEKGKPRSPEEFASEFIIAFPYNQESPYCIKLLVESLQ